MRRSIRSLLVTTSLCLSLGLAPSAMAQDDGFEDDEEFEFDGEDEPEDDDEDRLAEGDDLDQVDNAEKVDEELDEFSDPLEDEDGESDDLLGEEPTVDVNLSGDTAAVYRQTQDDVKDEGPDEELQVWEQYLQDYPNTPFRTRITKRIEVLESAMYNTRIGEDGKPIDALATEIKFAQALQLENIDPRTRVQVGAEWGLPAYVNVALDYEHAIVRTFSFHVGARRRYTGYNIESGVHWALVKSTRTQTLLTFIGDVHFNANPAFLGIRPQMALGKRFGDKLDAQIQIGPDIEMRNTLPVRLVGGVSTTYAASNTVKMFFETGWNMKQLTRDGGNYRFNVITFGMKFFPKSSDSGEPSDDMEVNMGATVPYTANYWSYHYGSVMTQANLYL